MSNWPASAFWVCFEACLFYNAAIFPRALVNVALLGVVMAWKLFGREAKHEWIGFLDQGVKLEGTLELQGTFRVDGNVKGTIICHDTLILGEKADVDGQIESAAVSVAGKCSGTIYAKNRVEILPTGTVVGEVHTPCLVMEAGGILDGRCHMLKVGETAQPVTIQLRAAAN